jgi:hypothetical protein
MTLPSSGPINISEYNTELELSSTIRQNLDSTLVRFLLQDTTPRAPISMSYGYGKSYTFKFNVNSGNNIDLRAEAIASGWNGFRPVLAYIPTGVIIGSTSVSAPALTIQGSFPNGITLVNDGYIVGAGGNGGNSIWATSVLGYPGSVNGANGGTAISVSTAVTIQNNEVIGGGGGGGGQGYCGDHLYWTLMDGPGGGGAGALVGNAGVCYLTAHGGSDNRWFTGGGYYVIYGAQNGQVGDLILGGLGAVGYSPDTSGVRQSGSGGLYSPELISTLQSDGIHYCIGGNGGNLGQPGGNGYSSFGDPNQGTGGAAGAAVIGNSYVTWSQTGIIFGSQS